jgi:riboflavin kinase/FMN adenylyltransferase
VQKILALHPQHIVIGYDFSFGANRMGDRQMLERLGERYGFSVSQVAPLVADGAPISSSRIRNDLAEGKIESVTAALGAPFLISGKVVKGYQRGRRIGFPTANILTSAEIIPRTGVYITRLFVDGKSYPAATNVGFNPTFQETGNGQKLTIEAHLLDADLDLYDKEVKLEFLSRLRDELKFSSADELVAQIKLDVVKTKEYFSRIS